MIFNAQKGGKEEEQAAKSSGIDKEKCRTSIKKQCNKINLWL